MKRNRVNHDTPPINWGDFYMICVGMMNMRPMDFWSLSPREMYLAIKGFQKFHGAKDDRPMKKDELDDLMELYPD